MKVRTREEAKKTLAERLQKKLRRSNLNYKTLSQETHISYGYVNKIFNGKSLPSMAYVCRIAYIMNIDIRYLLDGLEEFILPVGLSVPEDDKTHFLDVYYTNVDSIMLKEMNIKGVVSSESAKRLIANRVNYLIKKDNFTYKDYAKKIGCSQTYLRLICSAKNKPSLRMVDAMSQVSNIDLPSLLDGLEKYIGPKYIKIGANKKLTPSRLSRYYRSVNMYFEMEEDESYKEAKSILGPRGKGVYIKKIRDVSPGMKALVIHGDKKQIINIVDSNKDKIYGYLFQLSGVKENIEISRADIRELYEAHLIYNTI